MLPPMMLMMRLSGCLFFLSLLLAVGCSDPPITASDTALVSDTRDGYGPYRVVTTVSGIEGVERATLHFRPSHGDGSWSTTPMRPFGDNPARLAGEITPFADEGIRPWPMGTRVEYYVELQSGSGHIARDPAAAPDAAFAFLIGSPDDGIRVFEVLPAEGPSQGGTQVFVTGSGFRPDTELRFGPSRTLELEVVSPTFIRAVTPPGPPGLVDVTVIDDLGHADTLEDGFFYIPPPMPQALDPDSGPVTGDTAVVLTGENLQFGLRLFVDDIEIERFNHVSESEIRFRTPPHPPGFVDIVVFNPDGQRGTLENGFFYVPPPLITAIVPDKGPSLGGTAVEIQGAAFQEGAVVTFEGRTLDCTWVSDQLLTCVTDAHPAGFVDVTVTNPDGQSATRPSGYEFLDPPRVFGVIPPQGPITGDTPVEILGENFIEGAIVTFDGVEATGCVVLSRTRIECLTPPADDVGFVDVTVTNPDGQSGTLQDGFEYLLPPPVILSITPERGPDLGGTTVTLEVEWIQPGATVNFEGSVCVIQSIDTDGRRGTVVCVTTPHPEGFSDVTVTNPDGQLDTLTDGFYFIGPPEILTIDPDQGPDTGGTRVTITGRNFDDGMVVLFDGQPVTLLELDAAGGRVVIETDPHPVGFVDVTVRNPDGRSDTVEDGFEFIIAPPLITALIPDRGPTWGGNPVIIEGSAFRIGAAVLINGVQISAANVLFINAGRIEITSMPPGVAGPATVTVRNPDGQSDDETYTYVPIEITPEGGLTAGFTTITATGFDFVSGMTITIGGIPAESINVLSPQNVQFVTPAGALGARDVVVRLPDGRSEQLTAGFTYRHFVEQRGSGLDPSQRCQKVDLLDLDGDGDNDVLIGNGGFAADPGQNDIPNTFQLNTGGANFAPSVTMRPGERTTNHDFGDYDGDGDLDILTINLDGITRLYRNDGGANFVLTSGILPERGSIYDAKFIDVDLDGDPDIAMFDIGEIGFQTQDYLFINENGVYVDRTNTFPQPNGEEHDHDVDVGDVNGDGFPDMIVGIDNTIEFGGAQRYQASNRLYLNNRAGSFTVDRTQPVNTVHGDFLDMNLVDIDLDGDLDAVFPDNLDGTGPTTDPLTGRERNAVNIYLNDGAGNFTDATASHLPRGYIAPAFNITLIDFDQDSDLDLVVGTYTDFFNGALFENLIFVNDGTGRFVDAAVSWQPLAEPTINIGAADLNGDNHPDLVVCNYEGGNRLLLQRSN